MAFHSNGSILNDGSDFVDDDLDPGQQSAEPSLDGDVTVDTQVGEVEEGDGAGRPHMVSAPIKGLYHATSICLTLSYTHKSGWMCVCV